MKKQGKGDTANIPLSSSAGSINVQVYHEYKKVVFDMYPGNSHVAEIRGDQVTSRDGMDNQDKQNGMNSESAHVNSKWMMNPSRQAYSGPEDSSTDPQETLTETSTVTFVDNHTTKESADNDSLHGVGVVNFKEFMLIDDDDDGDMSLREKTVIDLSIMDRKAAVLVCGRLFSTSSGSLSEYKEASPAPEAPPPEEDENVHERKRCCLCTLL